MCLLESSSLMVCVKELTSVACNITSVASTSPVTNLTEQFRSTGWSIRLSTCLIFGVATIRLISLQYNFIVSWTSWTNTAETKGDWKVLMSVHAQNIMLTDSAILGSRSGFYADFNSSIWELTLLKYSVFYSVNCLLYCCFWWIIQ